MPEAPVKVANEADPPESISKANVHEKEALDYEGSVGEGPAMVSSGDDGLWNSATDTPPKGDMSKFSYLSAEDLKAINFLDGNTHSRK